MNYPEKQYPHSDLTGQIIDSSHCLQKEIGGGLNEKIYENALCVDLAFKGIHFSQQERFSVYYREKVMGTLIPDLVVDNKVIVDAKVVEEFSREHVAQILSYLKISKLEVGLLINFKHSTIQVKRVTNIRDKDAE